MNSMEFLIIGIVTSLIISALGIIHNDIKSISSDINQYNSNITKQNEILAKIVEAQEEEKNK